MFRGDHMQHVDQRGARPAGERVFFGAMAIALLAAVLLGFSRTFFLKPWFPEAVELAPPETFFLYHGAAFAAWYALLFVQAALIAAGNVRLHRKLGQSGVALAAVMVVLGIVGALIAAGRPTGFVGVPLPPLQFLVVPTAAMTLFAVFVSLAVARRGDPQSHKRYMLLASISMVEAAVARWPVGFVTMPSPVPGFGMAELLTCAFLAPIVGWDLASRGRLHGVTLWGGLTLIAVMPLRMLVSTTAAWQGFARWAVGLLG